MGAKRRAPRRHRPAEGREQRDGIDMLRIRLWNGTAFVWLPAPDGMGRVEMWGRLLSEAMLHIANAYRLSAGYDFDRTLERIRGALEDRLRDDIELHGVMCDN
jgi:hypothetical protein